MEVLIKNLEKGKKAFRPGRPKGYKEILVRQIGEAFLRNFERPRPHSGAFTEVVKFALEATGEGAGEREHRRIIDQVLKEHPFKKLS